MKRKLKDDEKDYCFNQLPLQERERRIKEPDRFRKHEFIRIPLFPKEVEKFDPLRIMTDSVGTKIVCKYCGYEPENEAHQFLEL